MDIAMTEKSHVTMEQAVCMVCGKPYDTGAILIDKRLRKRFDMHTVTGLGLCPEHQKMIDDGYVALIEADPEKSGVVKSTKTVDGESMHRTGNVAFISANVWGQVFDTPVPPKKIAFVEPGVFDRLKEITQTVETKKDGEAP